MTVRQSVGALPPGQVSDIARERLQRSHELSRAYDAARVFGERLELLGDRAHDVSVIRSLRASLARDLAELGRER